MCVQCAVCMVQCAGSHSPVSSKVFACPALSGISAYSQLTIITLTFSGAGETGTVRGEERSSSHERFVLSWVVSLDGWSLVLHGSEWGHQSLLQI